MDTIGYYNKYASAIFEQTVELDMEEQRKAFTGYLEEGDTILDLGCGSGRDSLAFYEQGFDVTPLDASEEMCKLAEIHTGLEVLNMAYEEMEFDEVFDGIWGNEALIHVPEDEIGSVMERVIEALCQAESSTSLSRREILKEFRTDVISASIHRKSWNVF